MATSTRPHTNLSGEHPVLPASSPMCEQSDILTSPTYSSRQSCFPMCELPLWLTPLALAHLTPPGRAASLGQPHSSSRQSSIVSHTHCLDEELSPLLQTVKLQLLKAGEVERIVSYLLLVVSSANHQLCSNEPYNVDITLVFRTIRNYLYNITTQVY